MLQTTNTGQQLQCDVTSLTGNGGGFESTLCPRVRPRDIPSLAALNEYTAEAHVIAQLETIHYLRHPHLRPID